MLEMLNPTGGDVLRFAANVMKVRKLLNGAMKRDPIEAQRLAVEQFCTLPESARRTPDLARLRDDSQRFFGWKAAQWKAHEQPLREMMDAAQLSTITHDGLRLQCYTWKPESKPRGRILLCHGWEGYALNFALLIQKALAAGFEVHAFDHLAHGRSEGKLGGLPIALGTLLAVAKYVEKTAGAIDVLVGHSLGGAAASWAAAHGEIACKRLVLIAPFYDTYKLSGLWAKAHFLSEDIRASLQAGLENSTGLKFTDFMPAGLAEHFNQRKQLKAMILHDAADKITDFKHSEMLSELAGNVRLHQANRLGHIAVLADEVCMDQIVAFANA
ncbi:alpha/beta fold hydrolase [Variovorax sp. PCZ-1]|uniref:alpha/beta hydrolase n=1 Tax=Variovorax sp. PCZ-1 TaxID=2835533 RepID=UPI001BCDF3D9|nr:alpha/beta fold hydrolase [Variovorax sp. PCZ-1]MBS7807386.1 alpha/beta fold hydrolase [Variovorax sp. PCZ-1]